MAWLCCHCGSLRADNVCVYEVTNVCGVSATAVLIITNAGIGTLTFSADVFLPTVALPCNVTGAPAISVSTDFTVLEVASLIPGFGSLANVARVINPNHTEYRYCRQTSVTISVAATSGKTNTLVGTTVALAQTNTVSACVGDTNTFNVTGEKLRRDHLGNRAPGRRRRRRVLPGHQYGPRGPDPSRLEQL